MNTPRLNFAHLPTPIEDLPRLTEYLSGPRLLIKRDDQTGLGFGGNKTRKLEFLVAEAQEQGAKTLISGGALQSNHCRQTAAAAAKYGFDCILVLNGEIPDKPSANLLLDQLFGAQIVTIAPAAAGAGGRVLRRPVYGRKGTALREGLEVLLREPFTHVAFLDADGQHDPADLGRLLEAARDGADFVFGSRLAGRALMPARSYWANTIGDKVLGRMTGLAVDDGQSGYRVIEANLLRRLQLVSRRFAIENEILVKAAPLVRRLEIVPVRTIYGVGRSHYRPLRDTWITAWLTVWYKTLGGEDR